MSTLGSEWYIVWQEIWTSGFGRRGPGQQEKDSVGRDKLEIEKDLLEGVPLLAEGDPGRQKRRHGFKEVPVLAEGYPGRQKRRHGFKGGTILAEGDPGLQKRRHRFKGVTFWAEGDASEILRLVIKRLVNYMLGRGVCTSQEARWHCREFEWAMMGRPSWPGASEFFNSTTRSDSLEMIGSVARGFGTSQEARRNWGVAE